MSRSKRVCPERDKAAMRLRFQAIGDPAIASYIASLKKKYKRYAMPSDEARKVIDASMGDKTLTELLYEARENYNVG